MSLSIGIFFDDLLSLTKDYINDNARDINFYTVLYCVKQKHRFNMGKIMSILLSDIKQILSIKTISFELRDLLVKYNRINRSDSINYDKLIDYLKLWEIFLVNVNKDNNKCIEIFKNIRNNSVLFYDDNADNLEDSHKCPNTTFIKIDIATKTLDSKSYNSYLNILSQQTNEMIAKFKQMNIINNFDTSYDHGAGFNISYIRFLILYLNIDSNFIKGVIFDWDRTLTLIEGVYDFESVNNFLSQNNLSEYKYNFSEYYFGGPIRIYYLKKLWEILEKKNIPVIILSRNEAIISSPNMFKELLGNIGIRINDNQLHCCYYDKKTKKKIFSSKYNYMKDYLPEICL